MFMRKVYRNCCCILKRRLLAVAVAVAVAVIFGAFASAFACAF